MDFKADDNVYILFTLKCCTITLIARAANLIIICIMTVSFASNLLCVCVCLWMRSKPTRKSTRSLMYGETLAEIITNGRLPAICEKLFYHFQQQRWEKQKWRLIFRSNFTIPLSVVAYPPNTLILLATTKWTFLSTDLKTDYKRIQYHIYRVYIVVHKPIS